MEHVKDFLGSTLGLGDIISPLNLLAFIGIAWLVFRWRRENGGFIAWLFPRRIWTHKSTPLSAYRQHPLGLIIGMSITTCITGLALGLIVGVIAPQTPIAEIIGVNAFVIIANATVANFHHSTNPAHFNRNYGQFLAVWDLMFGTLYITRGQEDVSFGLDGPSDAPLMTHRLGPILVDPMRRFLRLSR